MSLRFRLTLLYTSLIGGILLVFGIVIYQAVGITLTERIDDTLAHTASEVVDVIRVNAAGELVVQNAPNFDLATNVFVQVWESGSGLSYSSTNIRLLTWDCRL